MDSNKQPMERIREIFSEAQSLPPGEGRDRFLDKACGSDAGLRDEVESLLEAYETTDDFLRCDASGTLLSEGLDLVGTAIDEYSLVERIGEGGFGEVYRAEQSGPLHREVALKIIKLGMDTKNVLARFEAERQALARMNHPNIAQVYDAGVTETGRPYFVMELVRGIPFLEYCDQHCLPLSDRIQLFRQVCEAVQHAHQKGILHRDLKPSNILVCDENGKPLPKVIDFGVAKSLEGRLTEKTLATLQEMLLGTPMYMSPEQLDSDVSDIDTRTDIYSLGIILYELVTGAPPLGDKRPRSIAEMRKTMADTDFLRPSRVLHTLGEKTTAIARGRQIKRPTLERLLRGDLDWVVMKAIEKERDRRYGDVGTLARDLEHFLKHEPVSAGPPSLSYRSRKFIRRHRMGTVVAVSVGAALLLGAFVSTIGFLRASASAERARTQAVLAEATFRFLVDELLLQVDPWENGGREITLREGVDLAAEKLDFYFPEQPLACSRIHQVLSSIYIRLGRYDRAVDHAEQAFDLIRRELDPEDPDYLEARLILAEALYATGEKVKPRNIYRRTLEIQERNLGAEHPDTLETLRLLAWLTRNSEADSMFRRTVEIKQRTLGSEHVETLAAKEDLAIFLSRSGRVEESETTHREIVEALPRNEEIPEPFTLDAMHGLGTALIHAGKLEEAEGLLQEVYETQVRILGAEHPETLGTAHNLAALLVQKKQYRDAEKEFRSNLAVQQRKLGSDHPDALRSSYNLAYAIYCQKDRHEEAGNILQDLVRQEERIYGETAFWTWRSKTLLAQTLHEQGKHEESEQVYRQILGITNLPVRNYVRKRLAEELRHQGKE